MSQAAKQGGRPSKRLTVPHTSQAASGSAFASFLTQGFQSLGLGSLFSGNRGLRV